MRFQIDPRPGESQRACGAIARVVMPPSRATLIVLGLYVVVGVAAYVLTPATRFATLAIGVAAVIGTAYALQAEGRGRLARLQADDPHALETHFVELGPEGVHAWCSHIDARYPWRDFTRIAEDREFYLFARPNGTGAAIPKRLLDATMDQALRERIREWAPERGSSLARPAGSGS